MQQLTVVPQVEVRLRPEAAQIAGVTPAQVRDAMATLLRGTKVGEIYEDQKIFDVGRLERAGGARRSVRDQAAADRHRRAAGTCRSRPWPT